MVSESLEPQHPMAGNVIDRFVSNSGGTVKLVNAPDTTWPSDEDAATTVAFIEAKAHLMRVVLFEADAVSIAGADMSSTSLRPG